MTGRCRQGRAGVYTSTGNYVSGEVDEMNDNDTWEIRDLGPAYQYTIPLSEEASTGITAYNYNGQQITTAYNKAGQQVTAIYPYQQT